MKTHHCFHPRIGFFSLVAILPLLVATGCPKPPPPAPPVKAVASLRVMVVDDLPLADNLAREWLAHTERPLEVVQITADKAATAEQLPVDVVIYPPALLGQFATHDQLLPLDDATLAEPGYERADILPLDRTQLTQWGQRTVAVPLGSPQFVLLYRADLLDALGLSPPETWQDYAALVEKLKDKPAEATAADGKWQATAEPLAEGWGAKLLMARAASGAVHRDQLSPLFDLDKHEPLIASEPWQRALEELVAAQAGRPTDAPLLTPAACQETFLAGECALAITWPQQLDQQPASPLMPEQVGIAALPGSREAFNPSTKTWEPLREGESSYVPLIGFEGRLVSVTKASSQPRDAIAFALWLSGPKASGRIAPRSRATTVFRASHFRAGAGWQAPTAAPQLAPYGELLATAQDHPRRLLALRVPGNAEYLAALDAAVLAAVRGEKSAADSLANVADQWRTISKARGISAQQRALRMSLGLGD